MHYTDNCFPQIKTEANGKSSPSNLATDVSIKSLVSPMRLAQMVSMTSCRLVLQFPDIFKEKRIHIPADHPEYKKLKRYAVAYGAEMEPDEEEADIRIAVGEASADDKTVSSDWLYECVKRGEMV